MGDPNPRVSGRGFAKLRAAGIHVATGVCLEEALALNAGFVSRMSRGVPWTRLKMAVSLDGRSALPNGKSQWITSPQARADGHAWRARADLILTGIGTVRSDDPLLTVREIPVSRQPRKAVVDRTLQISATARLFDGEAVWIFTAQADEGKTARLARRNGHVIVAPTSASGQIDLPAMMQWLGRHDINDVHIEAGPRLSGALLAAGCVDEILAYVAPVLLGDGPGMVQLLPFADLEAAPRFDFIDVQSIGRDVRLRGRFEACWQALKGAATPS
jgi:diaminohydroxyphosphoribosylaminopyrimidine deaminase/5-amino-6-(5-phosphoribosylamino)uracil reductase